MLRDDTAIMLSKSKGGFPTSDVQAYLLFVFDRLKWFSKMSLLS